MGEREHEDSVFSLEGTWVEQTTYLSLSAYFQYQTNFLALIKLVHLLASASHKWKSLEQQIARVKEVWVAKKRVCDVAQTPQAKGGVTWQTW